MAGVERVDGGVMTVDTSVPDAELTREEIVARNLKAVEAHFHNETPETVEAAIDLYGDRISWEAPTRGVVMDDPKAVLAAYRDIFKTVRYKKVVPLRRFATEKFVFDDQVAWVEIVSDLMPNLPYPPGSDLCVRLAHVFEMEDGKIVREIAYEMWREDGSPEAVDRIPEGAKEINMEEGEASQQQ